MTPGAMVLTNKGQERIRVAPGRYWVKAIRMNQNSAIKTEEFEVADSQHVDVLIAGVQDKRFPKVEAIDSYSWNSIEKPVLRLTTVLGVETTVKLASSSHGEKSVEYNFYNNTSDWWPIALRLQTNAYLMIPLASIQDVTKAGNVHQVLLRNGKSFSGTLWTTVKSDKAHEYNLKDVTKMAILSVESYGATRQLGKQPPDGPHYRLALGVRGQPEFQVMNLRFRFDYKEMGKTTVGFGYVNELQTRVTISPNFHLNVDGSEVVASLNDFQTLDVEGRKITLTSDTGVKTTGQIKLRESLSAGGFAEGSDEWLYMDLADLSGARIAVRDVNRLLKKSHGRLNSNG